MSKIAIKNLPIEENIEYKIKIIENSKKGLLINLADCEYLISTPKNKSWKDIELSVDMVFMVKKVKYGKNDEYNRLDIIESIASENSKKEEPISDNKQENKTQRKFKLPGVDDLNKSQDKVLRLPEDGQFLIVGGPGTGKSVVALLRAMKYQKSNDYAFLTFNKVLLTATKQLVPFKLNSFTLDSWLGKAYWKAFKEYLPNMKKADRVPDYDKIMTNLEDNGIEESSHHIIIDEGQDKPAKYYESLMHFGIENFFIVADQNQQITEENSTRQELSDLLGLEVDDVIELKENYRNSRSIGVLNSHFFTDPSSPLPQLPSKYKISLGIPILYSYQNYQSCIKLILREADRDNRNLIGVIVANNELRDIYVKELNDMEINLDNPKATVSTYSSKDTKNPNIDFSCSGIVVLNDKSIKGLEFDIVYILIDGFSIYNNDIDSMKKRFYVMSSRAIKKLLFFKHDNYKGGVEEILPTDENILKRERLSNG